MQPRLSYIICATPRSGSWLLAAGLEDTALAGHPSEWFNMPEEKLRCEQWGIPYPIVNYQQYIDKVIKAGMARSDIFGVKCLGMHLEEMEQKFRTIPRYRDLPMKEIMPQVFPNTRYIRLQRRDITRQAISYYRAELTQKWWKISGREGAGNGQEPIYDANAIYRHEEHIHAKEAVWQRFFEESGFPFLLLYYEDMVENYEGTIRQALDYIGISNSGKIKPPRFEKQADTLTESWLPLYREYRREKGLI